MRRLAATMRLSQNARSPKTVNRSRTGTTRACMYRRVSARRRTTCAIQKISSTPGAASSHEIQRLAERQRVEIDAA